MKIERRYLEDELRIIDKKLHTFLAKKDNITHDEADEVNTLCARAEEIRTELGKMGGSASPGPSSGGKSQSEFEPKYWTNYRDLFGSNLSNGGFSSFGEFLRAIMAGGGDSRLQWRGADENAVVVAGSKRTATESPPSAGGFLVPDEFSAQLLDVGLEDSIVMPRAQVWPMKSATLKVPGWVIGNHGTNLYGGVTLAWEGEESSISDTPPKTRMIQLNAHGLKGYATSSNELKEDAPDFEARMSGILAKAAGWYADLAFLNATAGSGAGRPQSFMNSPALITVAKLTGQAASTILYGNLTRMFARMWPAGINRATWIASNTCIPQLMELTVPVGTGGSQVKVMNENNGVFSIFGRPVLFTEKVPALSSAGDISFVDFSQYCVGLRGQLQLAVSPHVLFQTDETAWRIVMRCDGQGTWDEVLTPKNGDSLSPFITLGAR